MAAARLRRSRSQAAVARDAGIAPSYLSRIETGKVQPTYRTLSRIARAMEVQLDELVPFDPAEHRHGVQCPISQEGTCMLDLIRPETYAAHGSHGEDYTPRQIKLIREFSLFIRRIPTDRQYALTVLMADLMRAWSDGNDDAGSGPLSRTPNK
ncbi:MAG: helix-turn-helix transcriptional regulator [Acidobacteriota bacterium]|nr:helix-turn-helix transcriptional regulator [Acidobacteriota bacterium]